ncbi:MAG: pyridoxamine 5'-phosphate oxidase family protein [Candidatus Lokiarchaeota archaeon]|nr:pyridoxamine 5'-phosphate oxidase family protein [Candidatus Lokiarchaeota archaeon]
MAPFKLESMTPQEIKALVQTSHLCRIAFKGDEHPYIAPFQYAYVNDSLYFHFAAYGRKMQYLSEDPNVCVEIERNMADMSDYRFVALSGTLVPVTDAAEKNAAINALTAVALREPFSPKFLAAHGFGSGMEWKSIDASALDLVVVKLTKIVEVTALKSPQGKAWG